MRTDLGEMEEKFADLIWQHAPVGSGELVRLCEQAFAWKKSTTYTMLARLCKRGLFVNDAGAVTALVTRSDFLSMRSETAVEDGFGGSLPMFVAAFTRRRKLSRSEIDALQKLIDESKEAP